MISHFNIKNKNSKFDLLNQFGLPENFHKIVKTVSSSSMHSYARLHQELIRNKVFIFSMQCKNSAFRMLIYLRFLRHSTRNETFFDYVQIMNILHYCQALEVLKVFKAFRCLASTRFALMDLGISVEILN